MVSQPPQKKSSRGVPRKAGKKASVYYTAVFQRAAERKKRRFEKRQLRLAMRRLKRAEEKTYYHR